MMNPPPSPWACLHAIGQWAWHQFSAHLAVVVAGLVILALVLLGIKIWPFKSAHAPKRILPNEYMYLDSARVDSYLGQLNRGDFQKEDLRETTTENSVLGLEVEKVGNATQSRGNQLERSVVVTKSEAERFDELLDEVTPHDKALVKLDANHECEFDSKLSPDRVSDGMLVEIKNASVQIPPFLSAYPEFRYASYRFLPHMIPRRIATAHGGHATLGRVDDEVFGELPLTNFETADAATVLSARRERRSFQRRVGKNPRIPMSFSVPSDAQTCKKVAKEGGATVVVPARFANLTGDPSLLSVPLTIVGLVTSDTETGYGDGLSASAYWPALRSARTSMLRQLGVRPRFLAMRPRRRRRHLFGAMERALTYRGHVVAVIPIAIYD